MNRTKIHKSVLVLFSVAIVLYLMGRVTAALSFSLIGFVFEIIAWVNWLAVDNNKELSSNPQQDNDANIDT